MLSADDLGKSFAPERWAVRHLTLVVPDGSLVMLLGANGAGKSTTINCFLDFIRPTEGAVRVDGVAVSENPLGAKRRLAFLSESLAVYPALTGLQNLLFFAGLGGTTRLSSMEGTTLLEGMGLPEGAVRRPVREYSKGMRQKLGLTIAWARRATNIILDEPTTGLDPTSARELLAALQRLRADGAAVLMSTHDVFRASTDADHVYVMKQGALVAEYGKEVIPTLQMEREYLRIMGDS